MEAKEKIILGIDPGTNIFGYGVVEITGSQINLIALGSINVSKKENHQLKLKYIFERVRWLVDEYKPDTCAIEAPFYGKNVQSMLKLGRAQGVSMAAVLTRDIPICEYSPKRIKQAITGNGNASKEQVAMMLQSICKFSKIPKNLDATDGLAVAICHFYQGKYKSNLVGKLNSWKDYIKKNPSKIKLKK